MYPDLPLPEGAPLAEASPQDLASYHRWFMASLAQRPSLLAAEVTASEGFGGWAADHSRQSLIALEAWLGPRLSHAPAPPPPVLAHPQDLRRFLDQPGLSARSLTLLLDCGFYLGQALAHHRTDCRWFQVRTGGRRFIDFGHVVLGPFALYSFNPVRLMTSKGHAHLTHPDKALSLAALFDHWRQKPVLDR